MGKMGAQTEGLAHRLVIGHVGSMKGNKKLSKYEDADGEVSWGEKSVW